MDKTAKLKQLIDEGKYYFLSRPRRFGKSLMVDTLQCLFEGRKGLFDGLYITGKWDWNTHYPVVRFGFGDGVAQSRVELDNRINQQLADNRKRLPIFKVLKYCDFTNLAQHLKSLYASIPHDWYRNNNIKNYKGHYASIFYSHFAALGLHVEVEDASVNGKVDMAIQYDSKTFIFEFKVVEKTPTNNALKQIIDKNYAEKYHNQTAEVWGIGVEFSKADKQIVHFAAQQL